MSDLHIYTDEAGCFTFRRAPNVSRYFIICSLISADSRLRSDLDDLRRRLIWEGVEVHDHFHATCDAQLVRNAVFDCLLKHDFTVQAQICEKSKAQPQVRNTKARFYKYPLYYLFRRGIGPRLGGSKRLLVTAASIGNKKERATFTTEIADVMDQTARGVQWAIDFRPSQADLGLQAVDYCAWAIQRKWELADTRSYDLIRDRITYEYDTWAHGRVNYY